MEWTNYETEIAYKYVKESLQVGLQYPPKNIRAIFKVLDIVHTLYIPQQIEGYFFLEELINSFIKQVNWQEISDYHNSLKEGNNGR